MHVYCMLGLTGMYNGKPVIEVTQKKLAVLEHIRWHCGYISGKIISRKYINGKIQHTFGRKLRWRSKEDPPFFARILVRVGHILEKRVKQHNAFAFRDNQKKRLKPEDLLSRLFVKDRFVPGKAPVYARHAFMHRLSVMKRVTREHTLVFAHMVYVENAPLRRSCLEEWRKLWRGDEGCALHEEEARSTFLKRHFVVLGDGKAQSSHARMRVCAKKRMKHGMHISS